MKIIHLEKGKDLIAYGIETGTEYQFFTIDRSNSIVPTNSYKKSDYRNYEHFAGVLGKFNPFTFILKEPFEVRQLDFETLQKH